MGYLHTHVHCKLFLHIYFPIFSHFQSFILNSHTILMTSHWISQNHVHERNNLTGHGNFSIAPSKKTHSKPTGKLHHFLCLNVFESMHTGNTITNCEYTPSFFKVNFRRLTQDSLFQNCWYFCTYITNNNILTLSSLLQGYGMVLSALAKQKQQSSFTYYQV